MPVRLRTWLPSYTTCTKFLQTTWQYWHIVFRLLGTVLQYRHVVYRLCGSTGTHSLQTIRSVTKVTRCFNLCCIYISINRKRGCNDTYSIMLVIRLLNFRSKRSSFCDRKIDSINVDFFQRSMRANGSRRSLKKIENRRSTGAIRSFVLKRGDNCQKHMKNTFYSIESIFFVIEKLIRS